MGLRAGGQNDQQVSQDCDKIHEKKYTEDDKLQFSIICESQENESRNNCMVYRFHVCGESDGKEMGQKENKLHEEQQYMK